MAENRHIIEIKDLHTDMFDDIIDVRTPSEYADDHIPGAINCPVLDDEQRAEIGTIYVQDSPFLARKKGAVLTAKNIAHHIEEKFSDKPKSWKPLIYCWRGGQRSGSMQIVLRQVGWNAIQLKGGYKAYRTDVLAKLKKLPQQFTYIKIAGPTGSGKTMLLKIMAEQGAQVLDLEGMAKHKGSVLGQDPETPVQTQKSFDTLLNKTLSAFDPSRPVFVESESRRIGGIHLPEMLYEEMKKADIITPDIPVEERINYLCREYTWCIEKPQHLKEKLIRLKELKGAETIDRWFDLIDNQNWHDLTQDLLETHYDPLYARSIKKGRDLKTKEHRIPAQKISEDAFSKLAQKIISL